MEDTDTLLPQIESQRQKCDNPSLKILSDILSIVGCIMSCFLLIVTHIEWNVKNDDHQQGLNVITCGICLAISLLQTFLIRKFITPLFALLVLTYVIYSGFIGVGICVLYPYNKTDQSLLYTSSFIYFTVAWTLPLLFICIILAVGFLLH